MKNDTFCVQRLSIQTREDVVVGSFAADGTKAFKGAFSFQYMGAAEYEFGSVPRALNDFASGTLVYGSFLLRGDEIPVSYKKSRPACTKAGKLRKKQPVYPPVADRTIYIICRKGDEAEVQNRVRLLAKGEIRPKMGTHFAMALDPVEDFDRETQGWFEMDNGFFFFLDHSMWEKTVQALTGRQTQWSPLTEIVKGGRVRRVNPKTKTLEYFTIAGEVPSKPNPIFGGTCMLVRVEETEEPLYRQYLEIDVTK